MGKDHKGGKLSKTISGTDPFHVTMSSGQQGSSQVCGEPHMLDQTCRAAQGPVPVPRVPGPWSLHLGLGRGSAGPKPSTRRWAEAAWVPGDLILKWGQRWCGPDPGTWDPIWTHTTHLAHKAKRFGITTLGGIGFEDRAEMPQVAFLIWEAVALALRNQDTWALLPPKHVLWGGTQTPGFCGWLCHS